MSPHQARGADVFSAIGDANRRRILQLLAERERSVGELTTELGIAQPSVSQHLVVLREVGLVEATPRGRASIYRPVPGGLSAVTAWVAAIDSEPR